MKVLKKTFKLIIAILSWSFLLLLAFLVWLLVSTSGSQFLIKKTSSLVGATAEQIEGTVASGLKIGRFTLDNDNMRIKVKNANIDVLWHRLFSLNVDVSVFHADVLSIQWYSAKQPSLDDNISLEWLRLPLNVNVDNIKIKQFRVQEYASKNDMKIQRPPLFSIVGNVHRFMAQLTRGGEGVALDGNIDVQLLSEGIHINTNVKASLNSKNIYTLPLTSIKATIQEGSVAHQRPLEGYIFIDTNPKDSEPIQIDSDIQWSNNTIRLQGGLGNQDSELTIQALLPELDKISAGAGISAEINGLIKGDATAHTLAFHGQYKRADMGAIIGQAPIDFSVALKGNLSHLSLPIRWQATMTDASFTHLSYQLTQQQAMPISISMGKLFKWSLGESSFTLTAPDKKEMLIQHLASSGEGDTVLSDGTIQNISLENHLYDFKWHIAYNNALQADIDVTRQGEALLPIQKNPMFNIKHLRFSFLPIGENHRLTIVGDGEKTSINGSIHLDTQSPYSLKKGDIVLALSDGSTAHVYAHTEKNGNKQHIYMDVDTKKLAVDTLSFNLIPKALLSGRIKTWFELTEKNQLLNMAIYSNIDKGSIWNKKPIQGTVDVVVSGIDDKKIEKREVFNPLLYWVDRADVDLKQGQNQISTKGAFGRDGDVLFVDIQARQLSDLYPSLQGGVSAKGKFTGAVDAHRVDMQVNYVADGTLNLKRSDIAKMHLEGDGAWLSFRKNAEGWWGSVRHLSGNYQGFGLEATERVDISFIPFDEEGRIEWSVGKAYFNVLLPGKHKVLAQNILATGKNATWQSKGAIDGFVINSALAKDINAFMTQEDPNSAVKKGGVFVRNKSNAKISSLVFDANWDIAFDNTLKGEVFIKRTAGDFMVPAPAPFPLGLQRFDAHLLFSPTSDSRSLLNGEINFFTKDKGNASAKLKSSFNGLSPEAGVMLTTKGEIKDIAWASVFTNDLLGLGGAVDFDMALQLQKNNQWKSSGYIHGKNLRILETENGVRLMNGTLKASLNNNSVRLETLHFPAVIRVMPTEERTKKWLKNNPSSQKGSLNAQGDWDITTAKGDIKLVLDHYPIMQRSDRFAMVSGHINIDAQLPKINLSGKAVADVGWASIDIKDNVPTVDSDVIVLSANNEPPPPNSHPIDFDMDIDVDLGQHFYLAGMGLNSGLVGGIHLLQKFGRLAAEGQFRTQGGRINVYGQHLKITKGEISFTGDVTNPALNIEAIRSGAEVEAGVHVVGTAKKPKIKLVSYPEVSEVEKLSWLIMGRGPDSSGADLGMILSVGSSFLEGEEPMYKKLGIDDIGIKAGTVGASNKLLATRTVGDSASYRSYDEVSQIAYATKKMGNGWNVSIEQAMAGTDIIIRGSYQLMKYITVDLKAGTINGLEFIYKRVFNN